MSNYLADVVMPPEPELAIPEGLPETQPEIPEAEPPSISDEPLEEEVFYDEEQAEQTEDPIPEPTRKKKIPQDEIFTPPKVKTILDPDSLKNLNGPL